ncbi:uncharacterized protein LOC117645973 [Thrips palmi]|uniref:DNA 3'-5' helicase n=1 Tax=Thrips palmi TaxID=161013 RepID=A0A6P8ZNJ3_THRPL|nr:uncharacterized protein LOC117645973 [Thrips palmi]
MNENEDSVNGPASEFPSSSQDSGPMSLDADDIPTHKEPPTNSYSFSCGHVSMNSSSVTNRPRPQFLENGLRSIQEIPERYRHVFGDYPCFNRIQSMVMDVVFYSSEPLVVTAPTGSGKTVLFELAIIHLLMSFESSSVQDDFKIVYMAPVKALCTEKLHDWARKFAKLNINCLEVTGDSEITDLDYLKKHQLILTTPEKWDSLTRRWRDHASLMKSVRLFLIDEVHILNDETRGPTLEAVVSRMKMLKFQQYSDNQSLPSLRFIAVSATIPNVEDLAQWLGSHHERSAKLFKIDEEMRPVKLTKIVKGYEQKGGSYMFDIHLSYKLKPIISQYSDGKPTLVFCSTRKSVLATAEVLAKMITFNFTENQKVELLQLSDQVVDKKVRESLMVGIGCHHAGLVMSDRNLLEKAFRDGLLPVLIATSTLAMGVNLPAHLVVVKSTQFYGSGGYQEYSDSQLLQMIGRAGRPQFDTTATAVIMTRASLQDHYSRLTAGTEPIQSSLHRHLVEHINAEVVLGTITDLPAAVDWIRSTFLFVRANRHPQQYGLAVDPGNAVKINAKLQDMMQVELNALARHKLVETNGMDVRETPAGRLMARYYIAFQTMKAFMEVQGTESLADLLAVVAKAAEFQDLQLRHDEKASLNALNSKKDGAPGLRFPIKGRIKDRDAKVNCLLQALLGGLHIVEPALQQEAGRVVRTAERLTKCLSEVVQLSGHYGALLSAMLLHKCVRCQLWETSALAARQLPRIGPVLAQLLVSAGKTSLALIASSNPRDLERIVNRLPPFGNELRDAAAGVPKLTVSLERHADNLGLQVDIGNLDVASRDPRHWVNVLVGDSENRVLVCDRFPCSKLFQGTYSNQIDVSVVTSRSVTAHVMSEMWIGIDAEQTVHLREPSPAPAARPQQPPKQRKTSFMDKMKEAASRMDDTPSYRLQANQVRGDYMSLSQRLEHFKKTPAKKLQHGVEDDDPDDPPCPATGAATLSSKPSQAAPRKPPVVVVTLDPWDEDSGDDVQDDVQVVPDESWTPKQEPVDAIEYSSYPNQPTIRNFFKPEPPASPSPPSCSTANFASAAADVKADAAPASRFDLDDSWDLDILVAVEGDTFVPCVKSVSESPEDSTPYPYRTDRENWAGCWDPDLSIGIDALLRSSDDEAAADDSVGVDDKKALLSSVEGDPPDIDWCGGRGEPGAPAPLDAPLPDSLVEMKIGSENNGWLEEPFDLSGLDIPEDLADTSKAHRASPLPQKEELEGDGPKAGSGVEKAGDTLEDWNRELEEWKKSELELDNLHKLAVAGPEDGTGVEKAGGDTLEDWNRELEAWKKSELELDNLHKLAVAGPEDGTGVEKAGGDTLEDWNRELEAWKKSELEIGSLENLASEPCWLGELDDAARDADPKAAGEGFHLLESGAGQDAADVSGKGGPYMQVHPVEMQVKSDDSAPHSGFGEGPQAHSTEIQVKSDDSAPHSGFGEGPQAHSTEIQVKSDDNAPHSGFGEGPQAHSTEIQVKSDDSASDIRLEEELQLCSTEIPRVKSDATHSTLGEDVQVHTTEIQVMSDEEGVPMEEVVPCPQAEECCQEESGQDAGPRPVASGECCQEESGQDGSPRPVASGECCQEESGKYAGPKPVASGERCQEESGQDASPRLPAPGERCQEESGQDADPRPPAAKETLEKADVSEPLPVKPTRGQVVGKESPRPERLDNTPLKEQAHGEEGLGRGVKEEHRVAKAKVLPFDVTVKRPRLFESESKAAKSSSPTSNHRKEIQLVVPDGPDAGNAPPLRPVPHRSQTLQAAVAAVRSSDSPLIKIRKQDPQSQGTVQLKDDTIAKLLADWSSRPQAKRVTTSAPSKLSKAMPLLAAGRQTPPPAAPMLHGVVHCGGARRTAAGTVTTAPAEDKQDDFLERILKEDCPRRLQGMLSNGKEVRPFNTERLRAAGVARAESCVFSKQLGKQLAQAVAPTIRPIMDTCRAPGEQAACRRGPSATSSDGQVATSATGTECDDAETARRPSPFAAPQEKSASGSPPRKKAAVAPAAQMPAVAASPSTNTDQPTPAAQGAQAPDWFDRLLSQPLTALVRRPTGLLGLRGTAKRKGDANAGSAVVFKKPTVPSVWQQMATQPQGSQP